MSDGPGNEFEAHLAVLLVSENVSLSLRTVVCRQIIEATATSKADSVVYQVIVPVLVKVLEMRRHGKKPKFSFIACATVRLVNMTCNEAQMKTMLGSLGAVRTLLQQLKDKDDNVKLYTLYLLVNLTKTPKYKMELYLWWLISLLPLMTRGMRPRPSL